MTTLTIRNVDAALKSGCASVRRATAVRWKPNCARFCATPWPPRAAVSSIWPKRSAGALHLWEASTSTRTRECRLASRPNLTGDRPRHQRHFRVDAGEAASDGAGLGGGAIARDALHDEHQSDRDPLRDRHVARRTAAHRSRYGGRGHVRRGFGRAKSCPMTAPRPPDTPRSCLPAAGSAARSRRSTH
jgi:hypothetical protein